MVKNLENELKVELIDRSSKKIELTVAGEIVLEEGQKILGLFDDLSSLLTDLMNLEKGKLKIGIPSLIGFLYFPKIIKGFRDLYPKISIQLVEHGVIKMKQAVNEGIIDLGVAALPVEDEFDVIPFVEEEMMLFVHSSHPLATREKVSLVEVKDESFVLFQDDSTLYQQIMQECIKAGFYPNVSYQSIYWDFITEMVGQNLGISIFPQSLAKKVDQSLIKAIPIVNPPIWKLGVILKKDKKNNK
uniref:HTH lysR-type domain-containing protein n=1 Tax=Batrachochytrium dendrobatidis (strain JAM81 / FGSC 10211) TaxID=684364 RepID=F4PF96_BATDJ|eukprot:XP_006683280.1 hypothetical protein BATDEDRAFT_93046 [Batrachochytrium dendrobatidis JAM81]